MGLPVIPKKKGGIKLIPGVTAPPSRTAFQPITRHRKSGVTRIIRDTYSNEARVAQQRNWFHLALDVKRRDGKKCVDCGKPEVPELGIFHEVHHIIPLSKGGVTAMANLITLCVGEDSCHQKRHRHTLRSTKGKVAFSSIKRK